MRGHLVQFDIAWENKTENYARARRLIAGAGVEPGDLVLLPEMFDTGFSFALERTADTDGATLAFIQSLARELHATVQGSRTIVGPDTRGRNRATIAGPDGSILVEYDKVHPFSFGRESESFTGGDRVVTYTWMRTEGSSVGSSASKGPTPVGPGSGGGEGGERAALTVCPAICYDARFPELFRLGLMQGAELFALGANWPAPRAHHWRALLIARAIENQAFVLGVNRCGTDPHLPYSGGSIAVGPKGDTLGELGPEEAVLSVEIDAAALREWRKTFPAWRDVRLLDSSQRDRVVRHLGRSMYADHFSQDPKVCGGAIVVKGTRVPLRTILATLAEGEATADVLRQFPTVTAEHLQAAIALASDPALIAMLETPLPDIAR